MNEHKNTILAIVLSLLVVVGWQYFVGYPQMQRQEAQHKQQAQTGTGAADPAAAGDARRRRCAAAERSFRAAADADARRR